MGCTIVWHRLGQALQRGWLVRGGLARCLWPLSRLYAFLTRQRQQAYATGRLPAEKIAVPVLIVGNAIAGGAGKTPVVMALADHLRAHGWSVGVIARGYGRQLKDCREVQIGSTAHEVGDEPLLAAHHFARTRNASHCVVPIFVAPQRAEAARALLARYPQTQLIISDDGLQHYRLQRDLEICVFDNRGLGNGWLLPAGPLREPWPRKPSSTVPCLVLHTGDQVAQGPGLAGFHARRSLADYALCSNGQRLALNDLKFSEQPLLALAGIAQPEAFFAMLRNHGLPLARSLALPDHFDFNGFTRPAESSYRLICTEKDAVKLWPLAADALAVPLVLSPEPAFLMAIDSWLARLLPDGPARPDTPLSSGSPSPF